MDAAHVLVVANKTASAPTLLEAVERRARAGPSRFTLLIPDMPDRWAADWTLQNALPQLERAAGGPVDGLVGGPDPFEAIETAVREQDIDEILISTLPRPVSRWLGRDLPGRVEQLGLPVTVVSAVD